MNTKTKMMLLSMLIFFSPSVWAETALNRDKMEQMFLQESSEKMEAMLLPQAKNGVAMAQYYLARVYNGGFMSDQPTEKSIPWLRKAAEQGYADACSMLGKAYKNGTGVKKSTNDSNLWYQKAIQVYRVQAKQGDLHSQYELAMMLATGKGVAEDDLKAYPWFLKSAKQSHYQAALDLARYHCAHSVTPLKPSAFSDFEIRKKYNQLIDRFPPSFHTCKSFYQLASKSNNVSFEVRAKALKELELLQNEVVSSYQKAQKLSSVKKLNEASDALMKARQHNLPEAMYMEALLVMNGAGDHPKVSGKRKSREDMVIYHLEQAAKREFPQAMFDLGRFYLQKREPRDATRWFTSFGELAARARNKKALNAAIQGLQQISQTLQYKPAGQYARKLMDLGR